MFSMSHRTLFSTPLWQPPESSNEIAQFYHIPPIIAICMFLQRHHALSCNFLQPNPLLFACFSRPMGRSQLIATESAVAVNCGPPVLPSRLTGPVAALKSISMSAPCATAPYPDAPWTLRSISERHRRKPFLVVQVGDGVDRIRVAHLDRIRHRLRRHDHLVA